MWTESSCANSANLENISATLSDIKFFLGVTFLARPVYSQNYLAKSTAFVDCHKVHSSSFDHKGAGGTFRLS